MIIALGLSAEATPVTPVYVNPYKKIKVLDSRCLNVSDATYFLST